MSDNTLHSVDNALLLLQILAQEGPELGVSELSRIMGLGKSTVYRLLTTLERRNMEVQNAASGKYKLGVGLIHLGVVVLEQVNVIQDARPFIEELSCSTGESTHLVLYSQGEITFVDKVEGGNPSKMTSRVGARKPAYCTATGKVLLASLPEQVREEHLAAVDFKEYTPYTITGREGLRAELEKIRQLGYGEDQQESEEGLVCFAAPIRGNSGEVIAAVSISGAASRMNHRRQEMTAAIKKTAEKISAACGWHPQYMWKK